MATAWQYSDGCVGRYRVYYTSYLFPPDKLNNMPDNWNPNEYDKATWRGLLWSSFPMTGDTFDPEKIEGLRELIDIYHYLAKERVVGKWVKVYHPKVSGDTPDWYLQRMSSDNRKGIIMPGHNLSTPIKIYPKGLLPDVTYNVSFQERSRTQNRLGSDLMVKGIEFQGVAAGELIYLNLPMHPGSGADKVAPTAPQQVVKRIGTNMDYAGVELTWNPGRDNNWISYYQIYRNGAPLGKVGKGTYYFDHALGADPGADYEVATVDGSGNLSAKVAAAGASRVADEVVDDASPALKYTGAGWKHERDVWAVSEGTESRTREAKDAVEYAFEGNRITWYGRLGAAMGQAEVYIDGQMDQRVESYDADEIPNVALYTRTFVAKGRHTIKIVAAGEHHWRSSDSWVVVDGLQVRTQPFILVEDAPGGGVRYEGGGWKHDGVWSAASGKTASWTDRAEDAAEYTFHGTGITWVGKRTLSGGMADVFVDGEWKARVDTYAPSFHRFRIDAQAGWQVPIFEMSWPEAGQHTIRIVVLPLKNMLSQGYDICLDAFHVVPA